MTTMRTWDGAAVGKLGELVKDEVDQRGSEAQLHRGKKFWGAMVHSGQL